MREKWSKNDVEVAVHTLADIVEIARIRGRIADVAIVVVAALPLGGVGVGSWRPPPGHRDDLDAVVWD